MAEYIGRYKYEDEDGDALLLENFDNSVLFITVIHMDSDNGMACTFRDSRQIREIAKKLNEIADKINGD